MQKIKQIKSNSSISIDNSNITINSLSNDAFGEFIPNGGIISIDLNVSGVNIPVSGEVLNGYMLCDGSAIPSGYKMSGFVPNLNSDVFLMGATESGIGNINSNNRVLTVDQLPTHSHNVSVNTNNTGGANINSGNASSNHNHNTNNLGNHTHSLHGKDARVYNSGNNTRTFTGGTQPVFSRNGQNSKDSLFNSSALDASVGTSSPSDNHGHSVNNIANHTHSLNSTLGNSGLSENIEFSPIYYSIVFLIAVR